jgi:glycosyltransferase involved in cell wall biosynthesis
MTTALIIDPGLAAVQGHNFGALLRISAELSRLDVEHACLVSIEADATVRKHGAPVLPKKGLWWRSQGTRSEFLAHAVEMARQFCFSFDEQASIDLLVFPCCDAVQVQALAMALQRRERSPAPDIVMWVLIPDFLEEYGGAFAALKAAVGDDRKIAVYCETAAMAAALGGIIGLEVGAVPSANVAGVSGKGRKRAGNIVPNLVSMGVGNTAKGYDLFPGAVERVLQSNADVTFWIHGVLTSDDQAQNLPAFDLLSKMGRRVRTSNAVLTPEEYLRHLLQADLLLLPYDDAVYKVRGSGLFNEARELGIPVVATRGCSFAQPAFEQGWGVEIVERNPGGVAEAILSAVSRLPELTERAGAAASAGSDGVATVLRDTVAKIRGRQDGADASRRAAAAAPAAQPLPTSLFSKVTLSNGAVLHGDAPVLLRKLMPWLPVRAQLSLLSRSVVGTSPEPYHYSVLVDVDRAAAHRFEPGRLLIVEVLIEVLAGAVGIVWVDGSGQPLQDTERYALEMPAVQRVVVSIPAVRAHRLVFRNVAAVATAASFRLRRLSVSKIVEPESWRLHA